MEVVVAAAWCVASTAARLLEGMFPCHLVGSRREGMLSFSNQEHELAMLHSSRAIPTALPASTSSWSLVPGPPAWSPVPPPGPAPGLFTWLPALDRVHVRPASACLNLGVLARRGHFSSFLDRRTHRQTTTKSVLQSFYPPLDQAFSRCRGVACFCLHYHAASRCSASCPPSHLWY